MSGELKLDPILESVIQRWYIVVVFGILGGVVGLFFALSRPPVYDASAVLTVGLNFDLTVPLTQYDEDLALHKVASVVVAESVWNQALLDAGIQATSDSDISGGTENSIGHWLARKGSRWEFTVSSSDPELSALVADAWASVGNATLNEILPHAFEAKSIQIQLNEVLVELGQARSDSSVPTDHIEHIQYVADQLQNQLQSELDAAQGVASFVSFDLTEGAVAPDKPTTSGRGQLVLAGMVMGLIVGIVAAIVVDIARTQESSI